MQTSLAVYWYNCLLKQNGTLKYLCTDGWMDGQTGDGEVIPMCPLAYAEDTKKKYFC